MDPGLRGVLMAISLFFGMVGMAEVGRRVATYRARGDPERVRSGMGVVEGAAFGLLGLILAFTFSGAANRFGCSFKIDKWRANHYFAMNGAGDQRPEFLEKCTRLNGRLVHLPVACHDGASHDVWLKRKLDNGGQEARSLRDPGAEVLRNGLADVRKCAPHS